MNGNGGLATRLIPSLLTKGKADLHMDITGNKKGRYVRLFLKDSKEPLSLEGKLRVFG